MQPWKTLKHLSCASSLLQSSCRHRNVVVIQSATFFSRSKKSPSTLTGADLEDIKSAGATDNAPPPSHLDNTALTVNRGPLPLITSRQLKYVDPSREPRQAWLENLDTVEEKKLGLVDLHPDVFGVFPRLDIISENVRWQRLYKTVNWDWTPSRGQIKATGRKPWPQKGLGRARHGDIKSPIWLDGAKAHGPKGPKSYYFMLPYYKRILGLTSTLSVKHAQDDLKIVDSLDIPTDDPKFLEELVEKRAWGLSVLFVDDSDIAPRNIALASDSIGHMNIMPLYGLNVLSMTKHETLVLTLAALNKLEEKLVMHTNRHDPRPPTARKIYTGIY